MKVGELMHRKKDFIGNSGSHTDANDAVSVNEGNKK